ncbi:hypothetical protein ACIQOW_08410 [Kitasatospora sp. NPDC091335]|uniref:hypothetical protein n=1 Tax=Kitasatospora sp. NPDC091335 TaxID=3364085 RepID=UPI003819B3F4
MYLVYHPEGSDEPQRFPYQPTKLMSAEREKLEKLSGRDFSDFTQSVIKGNGLCRRALLFVFLKRAHPTLRFDDVDFAWDELTLEHSRAELELIRAEAAESVPADQRAAVLAQLDREIAEAYEEPEGKVLPPIAG